MVTELLLENGDNWSSTTLEGWIWYTTTKGNNNNEIYFQQDGTPPHFHVNVRSFLERTFNQRWIERRGSAMEFPPPSPDLTPLDFYLCGTLKNTIICHKTTNTGGTERSDWRCHQWYSISNNPDGMSLSSTSLLGVYSGRRWTFWTCTGLRKFKY